MKLPITAAVLLAAAALTQAQVPSLINYQGRLTTPSGAPASGTKNFSISIFDAETGGTLLYTESVGPVTLDATGVYNFQFGTAGTSNTQVVETLATTDGTASSFQKVLANTGVVAGSLSVTDGTYTWSQAAGSSNEDDFGVAYSSSLRRVTVSYFSAPPAAGRSIAATYRYATNGISGAISTGSQHWMAISIDGVAQSGRQRVLAVPFAMQAGFAARAGELVDKERLWRPALIRVEKENSWVVTPVYGFYGSYNYGTYGRNGEFELDSEIRRLTSITVKGWVTSHTAQSPSTAEIVLQDRNSGTELFRKMISGVFGVQDNTFSFTEKLNVALDPQRIYITRINLKTPTTNDVTYISDVSFQVIK
jgi:hypothetical protein